MKTALVTGANSGMGYAAAVDLAKKGYRVVMLCRSKERGMDAVQRAKKESQSGWIELELLDLSSFNSIRNCAKRILAVYPKIDVLINNAGVVTTKKEYTENGFEKMMGVNYLGPFLLTLLLIPLLNKADHARIVIVSSGAYKFAKLNLADFNSDKHFSVWANYGRSKLADLLFTRELAKRLRMTNITVNALHPGAVATSLGVNRETGFGKTVYTVLTPFFRTPEKGAETIVYLADSDEVAGISGQYYYDKKLKETDGEANDSRLGGQLFRLSEKLTGVTLQDQLATAEQKTRSYKIIR